MEYYQTCPYLDAPLHPTGFLHIVIVFPILSIIIGFCSLCTNDIAFLSHGSCTLFFFAHQLFFWKQFFSWWPTISILYCCVMPVMLSVFYTYSENKLHMKLKLLQLILSSVQIMSLLLFLVIFSIIVCQKAVIQTN